MAYPSAGRQFANFDFDYVYFILILFYFILILFILILLPTRVSPWVWATVCKRRFLSHTQGGLDGKSMYFQPGPMGMVFCHREKCVSPWVRARSLELPVGTI